MSRTTQTLEAYVKVTVLKTMKTYHRKYLYAKQVTTKLGDEYFLRKGRGWRKVNKEEFDKATTEEAVKQLHKKLEEELRQRVEREMGVAINE